MLREGLRCNQEAEQMGGLGAHLMHPGAVQLGLQPCRLNKHAGCIICIDAHIIFLLVQKHNKQHQVKSLQLRCGNSEMYLLQF